MQNCISRTGDSYDTQVKLIIQSRRNGIPTKPINTQKHGLKRSPICVFTDETMIIITEYKAQFPVKSNTTGKLLNTLHIHEVWY